jgi:UDP-N-acetyl-D-galactosamine dehydrogenase
VADIIAELKSYGVDVHVHDPVAESDDAVHEYGVELQRWDDLPRADAIVAAVPHRELLAIPHGELCAKLTPLGCFIDVKSAFDLAPIAAAGHAVWRL